MADSTLSPPMRVADASIFVGTFAAIVVMIAALLALDLFLARIDSNESRAHAASEYAAGAAALQSGKAAEASRRFGAALALDRTNVDYALALGESMLAEGRTAEAETTLRALLDRADNDGAVNLAMAHVMLREGKTASAKAYFHRAVFGRWGADSVAQRRQARFELIDLLARSGAKRELLVELIPFEDTPPDSVDLRRRLGQLFIAAGAPTRAANMYRGVLRRDAQDAGAYAGMGEAALALGNFQTARADLAEASRLRPGDQRLVARLALADTVLALDPTARGAGPAERLTRGRTLLARTLSALAACGAPRSALVDSARALLAPATARRGTKRSVADPAEVMLGVSIDLWSERPVSCATPKDEALRLVQNRLAQ